MIKAVPTRTRFTLLKPKQEVKPHIDNDPSYIIRIHFPVFTNLDCKFGFIWQGKKYEYHMEVGKVYMVNNGITHWAYNAGDTDRMHLVVSVNGQEDYINNKCKIYPLE
jgi:aspartyl/asparaginyl beta-hydroxylase (cupin superfamily)